MEFVAEHDEDLPDGLMAARAIEQLSALQKSGQRFFLGLGFFKPHLPFVATKADWEAMEKVVVPPPPHPEKPDSDYWHSSAEFYGYRWPFAKTNPLAAADQLRVRRAYLACVRYADRQVGKVLDALDTLGLADSTLVVVWGDNGWHLGDSQLWGKHTPFERAMHTPLIIRAPGMRRVGARLTASGAAGATPPTRTCPNTAVARAAPPRAATRPSPTARAAGFVSRAPTTFTPGR
jgi:arylsulfatase A-like enzyme